MATLRKCGPGKFDLVIDAFIYQLSIGRYNEDREPEGDVWAGLIRNPDNHITDDADLTEEEKVFLRAQVGCIITEDCEGFVCVEYFKDKGELDQAWAKILEEEVSR